MATAEGPTSTHYHRGLEAESKLDLFEAKAHYLAAASDPSAAPGTREHVAWFLYQNGFHDRQCLDMLEAIRGSASDPAAVGRAIRQLRGELGLSPPAGQDSRPQAATGKGLPSQLLQARQAFWSGQLERAQEAYTRLIERQPANAALRWELAKVLVARGDYDAAAGHLTEAQRLQPGATEILLDQATVEALRGHRAQALDLADGMRLADPAPVHLVRARAHHYTGHFPAAAREYRQVLATRPHHELASHGLVECNQRNGALGEAERALASWNAHPGTLDWTPRQSLQNELASPRVHAGASHFSNSLDYQTWSVGIDLRLRPQPACQLDLAATHDWFSQDRFPSVERNALAAALRWQPDDNWALLAHLGVSDYNHGWTSVSGGIGLMLRPHPELELNLSAEHLDLIDSEPPMGMSLYDLANTIGAVSGHATMDAVTASALWTPVDRLEMFVKYRIARLDDDNTLNDAYASIAWVLSRTPLLRAGYGIAYLTTEDPAPVFTSGTASTPYYYDPSHAVVHNLYLEFAHYDAGNLSYGAEAHLYLQPDDNTTGYGIFGFIRYAFNDRHALRLDARFFSQNRGRNRNQSASGHYDALNLVASYEYSF